MNKRFLYAAKAPSYEIAARKSAKGSRINLRREPARKLRALSEDFQLLCNLVHFGELLERTSLLLKKFDVGVADRLYLLHRCLRTRSRSLRLRVNGHERRGP